MTNYERIKNMSVEEMAQRILDGISSDPCAYCQHNDYACDMGYGCDNTNDLETLKQWLESEVDNNAE